MKRIFALLMIAVLAISLCACGESSSYDKEDQLRDQIGQLENELDNAKQNADQFKQDVDDYYDALDELDKYN